MSDKPEKLTQLRRSSQRNWPDLGSYSYFCGELRHEFIRLCEEGLRLAKKFRREDVLQEWKPKRMLEMYYEQTQEERDIEQHIKTPI